MLLGLMGGVALGCAGCDVVDRIDPADEVALGKAYVGKRGCGSCHDSVAGVMAGQSMPVPKSTTYGSNLTPDVATGIGGWADIQVVRAMRTAVDSDGEQMCPTMPHLETMTDLEANAIVAYLRSLPSVTNAVPPSVCPPIKGEVRDLSASLPADMSMSSVGDGG